MKTANTLSRSRLRWLSLFVVLFALVLLAKLYLLQIVHGGDYAERADRQYVQSKSSYDRGTIYFTSKDGDLLSAATLKTGFTVSITPKLVVDEAGTYEKLSNIVAISKDDFLAKAAKKSDPYEEIATKIPEDSADRIQALKLPGVAVTQQKWRFYPAGSLGAHELGFVGYKGDGTNLVGRYGLEQYYEDTLSRSDQNLNVNFFAELFSDVSKTLGNPNQQAGDVETTIEPTVQAELEKELAQVTKDWKPEMTGGIVINPQTGEIYAMASNPTFDPNTFNTVKDPSVFTDHLVESDYEMGSIIKPLTMAAGIDSGAITPDSTYDDTGCIELDKKRICNFDGKPRGVIPMQQILSQSLNVGASYIALKMGNDAFSSYMKNYGIGQETGIDLPGEIHGLIKNLDSTRQVEQATASFGQGIAITPIETARALSTLANGGMLINPHLVKQIDYKLGYSKVPSYGSEKQVLKKTTTDAVTKMLIQVVDKSLKNGTVMLPHWSIAAKTGTAQVANPAGGGYYTDRYLHSFFGYFPAKNPRFLVFLYQVYPKGAEYASATLTSPFFDLTKFLINYYNIPPDR